MLYHNSDNLKKNSISSFLPPSWPSIFSATPFVSSRCKCFFVLRYPVTYYENRNLFIQYISFYFVVKTKSRIPTNILAVATIEKKKIHQRFSSERRLFFLVNLILFQCSLIPWSEKSFVFFVHIFLPSAFRSNKTWRAFFSILPPITFILKTLNIIIMSIFSTQLPNFIEKIENLKIFAIFSKRKISLFMGIESTCEK